MVKPKKRRKAMMVKSKAVFGSERFMLNGFDGLLFHPLGLISRSTHSDTAGAVPWEFVSLKTLTPEGHRPPSHFKGIGESQRQQYPQQ
jgi:hypothetical protein